MIYFIDNLWCVPTMDLSLTYLLKKIGHVFVNLVRSVHHDPVTGLLYVFDCVIICNSITSRPQGRLQERVLAAPDGQNRARDLWGLTRREPG